MFVVFVFKITVNNFENNTMKLLVNEVKLKGLWASKQDNLRAQKVSGSFEKRARQIIPKECTHKKLSVSIFIIETDS